MFGCVWRITIAGCVVLLAPLGGFGQGDRVPFHDNAANRATTNDGAPVARPVGMTLNWLEQLALERNPTIVQAVAQVRLSQGKALQAGLYPNPNVGYVAEQIGVEGTAGELQGMFVEQQIVTGGKLRLSRDKFLQEARQAELQVVAQRYRVLYGVRVAFYKILLRQRQLELRRRLFQLYEEIVVTVEQLVNVGQANRADLLQAQLEQQRARAALQVAQRRYEGSWLELGAVVGAPDLPPNPLEGGLEVRDEDLLDRDSALHELLMQSPTLLVARAEVARDQIAVQRERAEPIPNVNVRMETGYNVESRDAVAGVSLGLRLPLFDRNQGTIAQAQAELTRAQAEVHRRELMLRRRFAQVFAEYEAARLSAGVIREEALPKAEEVHRLYLEAFQMRRAAWPQVLDAQRTYYQLADEYLDQLMETRRAEASILGLLLDDALDQPPTPTPEGHRDATPRPR